MDLDVQKDLLRRLFELKQAGTTAMGDEIRHQPTHVYADPQHLAREMRVLFRAHPLVVGLSADLPECGGYRTIEVAGVPVLLVRGEDSVIRAFLNSCRHRGSRVVEGNGVAARVFKCPYHAWCYDINGQLLGQPLAQHAFAGTDQDQLGLVRLPVTESAGLVILTPSADGADIDGDRHLAGLTPELDSLDLAEFTLFAEQHHTVRANWKQPYETFLEAYHVFALHRTTLAKQIMSTPMLADFYGPHGRGVLMGRDTPKVMNLAPSQWPPLRNCGANLVYWLFPNAILSLPMTGHAELWLTYPDPHDPGTCHVHLKFYTPAENTAEDRTPFWQRMLDYTSTIVVNEDFAQQADIHHGLASGSHPGLIFGRNEPALIHYHRALDTALSSSPSPGPKPDPPQNEPVSR